MDIVKIAYEKYKLDWMISHGHTLEELVHELSIMQKRRRFNYCFKFIRRLGI